MANHAQGTLQVTDLYVSSLLKTMLNTVIQIQFDKKINETVEQINTDANDHLLDSNKLVMKFPCNEMIKRIYPKKVYTPVPVHNQTRSVCLYTGSSRWLMRLGGWASTEIADPALVGFDNFEWNFGYSMTFGLIVVDRTIQSGW